MNKHIFYSIICFLISTTLNGAVLFAGNKTDEISCLLGSGVQEWGDELKIDLAPLSLHSYGYEGNKLIDVLHSTEGLTLEDMPRAIVVYPGSGDIDAGFSAREFTAGFNLFQEEVHSRIPACRIYFISVVPAAYQENLRPEIYKVNQSIREASIKDKHLFYVDIASKMTGAGDVPERSFFQGESLQMNQRGYMIFRDVLRAVLLEHEFQYEESWTRKSRTVVGDLKCEYETNPLGLGKLHPRLSWRIWSQKRGQKQTAYQLIVSSSREKLQNEEGDIWNSGKVISDQSVQLPYSGPELKSGQKCYWKVRIWDKDDKATGYSSSASWQMALLNPGDWSARWISAPRVFDWNKRDVFRKTLDKKAPPQHDDASPIFRKEFKVNKTLKSATAYISGLGYYEFFINGKKVGDHLLDPAFTAYDKQVLYVTYDLTELLEEGENALGVMLGNGWYNMFTRALWSFDRALWRNDPTLLCQIELSYNDGSTETIISDDSWKCAPGPITFNSIRQGETYDARLEQEGWNTVGFNEAEWEWARIVDGPKGELEAQTLPPIRVVRSLSPQCVRRINDTTWVYDFGENIAGFAELAISGKKGTAITLRYGERLDSLGRVDQTEISAYVREERFQEDVYILNGSSMKTWHPRFTYHGFRYVELSGVSEKSECTSITASVIRTDFEKAGYFHSSNDLLNSIHEISLRSFESNFHGFPSDCPHREKNGWLNDGMIGAEAGILNYKSQTAYAKWAKDILAGMTKEGVIPPIAPDAGWGYNWNIGPAYDNAILLIPWYLYVYSGDVDILDESYPSIITYFENYRRQAKNNLLDLGLGDWVSIKTQTPKIVTGSAYYYLSAKLISNMALILNKKEDAREYGKLAEQIKASFNMHLFNKTTGLYGNASQTSQGVALDFGLVEPAYRLIVLDNLERLIDSTDLNLDFGMIGSKVVLNALATSGKARVAYNIVNSTAFPGWGNLAHRGATNLWETWDGEKLSLNHNLFGDINAWIIKTLPGIRPNENYPGFKRFTINPYIPDDMKWQESAYQTLYGNIRVFWEKNEKGYIMRLDVPCNTQAEVYFDVNSVCEIYEGGIQIKDNEDIKVFDEGLEGVILELESGQYEFEVVKNL